MTSEMGKLDRSKARLAAMMLGTALGSLLLAGDAHAAATIQVNSTADEAGVVNGNCSLREGIQSALADNNVGGCASTGAYGANDTVSVPPGLYRLTIPAPGAVEAGDFEIDEAITIRGTGDGQTTIEQTTTDGVFEPSGAGTLTLENLVVQGGVASSGGLINNTASGLVIRNSTLRNGRALSFNGGAISSIQGGLESVLIENSTISGNSAADDGGGIRLSGGTAVLRNVTITNNTADADDDADVDVGGGYAVENTTTLTVANSIVAGNAVTGNGQSANCAASPDTFEGANLFGTQAPNECSKGPNDLITAAPLLGPLADNGGATPTHALLDGSPAIDAGSNCLGTDQRGVERFIGGPCDIGAYERVLCEGRAANRVGTAGDDLLTGTDGDDVFLLLAGNDTIHGLGGNDSACGGEGNDLFEGGDGDDRWLGGEGFDAALGGDGDDQLAGEAGNDSGEGGPGNDEVSGEAGKDALKGGAGKDRLNGGGGKDRLKGGGGKDKLAGGGGKDRCSGGGGKDTGAGCERKSGI